MIHHNNNGQEYLMVTAPQAAKSFIIDDDLFFKIGSVAGFIQLPSGQWQILFLASSATEEQAGEVVEKRKGKYNVYKYYTQDDWWVSTALESLSSLLSSHGMEGETLFLKRVK